MGDRRTNPEHSGPTSLLNHLVVFDRFIQQLLFLPDSIPQLLCNFSVKRLTTLADNVEQTIRALVGHVSKLILERYSHIRGEAKREAIAALHSARAEVTRRGHKSGHNHAIAGRRCLA